MAVQIISLIIALLAVIIGPIITYRITKKNLEFQFRSQIQEKWIEKLETVSFEFLDSNVQWVNKYNGLIMRSAQHTESMTEVNRLIDKMLDSINSSIVKLDLLLDQTKPTQKTIIEQCENMRNIILKKDLDETDLGRLADAHQIIVTNLKNIFQEERKKITKIFR